MGPRPVGRRDRDVQLWGHAHLVLLVQLTGTVRNVRNSSTGAGARLNSRDNRQLSKRHRLVRRTDLGQEAVQLRVWGGSAWAVGGGSAKRDVAAAVAAGAAVGAVAAVEAFISTQDSDPAGTQQDPAS